MKTLTPTEAQVQPRSELKMFDRWLSESVRALINRKSAGGRQPAFLFLGRHEANLLRNHLGRAFGPESVRSLGNVYYMGLEVREIEANFYFRTAGSKRVEGLEEALNRKPNHHDLEASAFWHHAVL